MSQRILRHPSGLVITTGWDPDQGTFYLEVQHGGRVHRAPDPLGLEDVMAHIRATTDCEVPPTLRTGLHADQLCQSRALVVEYELGS